MHCGFAFGVRRALQVQVADIPPRCSPARRGLPLEHSNAPRRRCHAPCPQRRRCPPAKLRTVTSSRQRRWWPRRPWADVVVGEAAPAFAAAEQVERANRDRIGNRIGDDGVGSGVTARRLGQRRAPRSEASEPSPCVPQVGSRLGPSKVVARGGGGKSEREGCRFKSF